MSLSINNLSNSYLQSITAALGGAGSASQTGNGLGVSALASSQADSSRLSPFAQLMATLQQLQLANPAQYQQLTGKIAANLQSAAKAAQADGNTAAATQLNQLATGFASASTSGQMPGVQTLAQAFGGHHHHHHFHVSSADSDTDSTSAQTSNTTQSGSDPASIIFNTLSSSGIPLSQ